MHKIVTAIVAFTMLMAPAFGMGWLGWDDDHHGGKGGKYHPAPGPIVGASLPVLAVGFGVYWLVRRARRRSGQ